MLAVRSNQIVRLVEPEGLVETDPGTVADEWPPEKWTMLAAGEGSKGLRLYEWAVWRCRARATRIMSVGC